jgi:biopolymer transport protein TolR
MAMSLGSGRSKAEINMTPMIDVLLVLIIIFLVIQPAVPTGLETSPPQSPPQMHNRQHHTTSSSPWNAVEPCV